MPAPRPISKISASESAVAIDNSDKEAVLIEILHTGLDLRATAAEAGFPILSYLAELLARRAREELDATATPVDERVDEPAA